MSIQDFRNIPKRIFLDSSTLQFLNDYGGYIWENEPVLNGDRIFKISNGVEIIESLRKIFIINERALWQFALSENSFMEIRGKNDKHLIGFSLDVLDHWQICLEESGFDLIDIKNDYYEKAYQKLDNNIGKGDLKLLIDAKRFNCDAFLTCDFKLEKSKETVDKYLDLDLFTPISFWKFIEPWARLFV